MTATTIDPRTMSPAQRFAALPEEDRAALLAGLSEADLDAMRRDWRFWARPNQLPPTDRPWWVWVVLAGRGFGKTRVGAEFVLDRSVAFHRQGIPHRVALIGRTAADCRDTMVEGESGLAECADRRGIRLKYEPSKRRVTLPDLDTMMTTFSAEEPDSLRGPQHSTAWGDEPASWAHKVDAQGNTAWSNAEFGLRLHDPKAILTGTPKPIPFIKALVEEAADPDGRVALTQGSLRDNAPNLAPSFVQTILAQYGGTLLGAQEIDGMLVDRVEGALWTPEQIEAGRLRSEAQVPPLAKIVVAVDPPAETAAECGIVVVGVEANPANPQRRHVFVLADESIRGSAETWSAKVIETYHRWQANEVVGEVNNGGDMVRAVVHLQDPTVPFRKVRATDGKRRRAEPVAMLYQAESPTAVRAHHVGYFGALEAQMTTWTDSPGEPSPDRMDALVWGVSALVPLAGQAPARSASPAAARLPGAASRAPHRMAG